MVPLKAFSRDYVVTKTLDRYILPVVFFFSFYLLIVRRDIIYRNNFFITQPNTELRIIRNEFLLQGAKIDIKISVTPFICNLSIVK